MRHIIKAIVSAAVLTTFAVISLSAQNVQESRKYRVVAYKSGNPAVTSTSNTAEVVPYMSIYIPNSFTPNGDGMNDTFGAYGEAIKEFKMQVFNRWGQVVFESNHYSQRWDGTFEGEQAPQGAYVYRITATGITGKPSTKDGTVNLIH